MSDAPVPSVDKFGPTLCQILISLVQEMADHCRQKSVPLNSISAFSDASDEWPAAMLSIYESMYLADCQKMAALMKAKHLPPKRRSIPDSVNCFSSVIRPFLSYIDSQRQLN